MRYIICLMLLMCLLGLVGCSTTSKTDSPTSPGSALSLPTSYNVTTTVTLGNVTANSLLQQSLFFFNHNANEFFAIVTSFNGTTMLEVNGNYYWTRYLDSEAATCSLIATKINNNETKWKLIEEGSATPDIEATLNNTITNKGIITKYMGSAPWIILSWEAQSGGVSFSSADNPAYIYSTLINTNGTGHNYYDNLWSGHITSNWTSSGSHGDYKEQTTPQETW